MKRGAPSKYDEKESPRLAGWLARDGKTDKEIASGLGIAESTINEWKKKYPEFSESLKDNKAVIDNKVEDSLLKLCLGYDYEKVELEAHVSGGKEYKKKKTTTMHVSPDPTSIIFWLSNRKKDAWKRNAAVGDIDFEKAKGEISQIFDDMKRGAGTAPST